MKRFFSKLTNGMRQINKPAPAKRRERRTMLRLEEMEPRLLLSNSPLLTPVLPVQNSAHTAELTVAPANNSPVVNSAPSANLILPGLMSIDPITIKYILLGGGSGILGKPVTPEQPTPNGAGRYEVFQHGAIYWSSATGAHDIYGPLWTKYQATANETDAYGRTVQSLLGLPTSDTESVSGVSGAQVSYFQGGAIFWSQATGAHVVYGAIWSEYKALANERDAGGRNVQLLVGLPTSDEMNVPGVSGARMNTFQGGTIYWSPNTGAHVVYGLIGTEYKALANERDYYGHNVQLLVGLPTSDEASTSGAPTARVSHFQHGDIYWSPATGAHVLYGAIDAKYNSLGGPNFLGLPTDDETTTPDFAGRYNHFELVNSKGTWPGAIDWTPATGAHDVQGAIAAEFAKLDWEYFGEAVTDEIDIATLLTFTGAYNRFQFQIGPVVLHRAIDWTPQNGATPVDHGTQYSDISQGSNGTCWIDASIAELASHEELSHLIHYQGNNTYTVSLCNFNDTKNRYGGSGMHPDTVIVYFDGTTYGADLHFNPNDPSQSWALILQRAVIEAVEEWDPSQSIQNPHSGYAGDALSILTGQTAQWGPMPSSIWLQPIFEQVLEKEVAAGVNLCLHTNGTTQTLVHDHVYAVLGANAQGVTLYNPWGNSETVSWSVIFQDGAGFAID